MVGLIAFTVFPALYYLVLIACLLGLRAFNKYLFSWLFFSFSVGCCCGVLAVIVAMLHSFESASVVATAWSGFIIAFGAPIVMALINRKYFVRQNLHHYV